MNRSNQSVYVELSHSSNSIKAILLVSVLVLSGAAFAIAEDSEDTDSLPQNYYELIWDGNVILFS